MFQLMLAAAAIVIILLLCRLFLYRKEIERSREAEAQKSMLFAKLVHEIRTPVNGIKCLNHLIAQNIGGSSSLKDYLEQSDAAVKYLSSIVNDILDMTKLEQGKMQLRREAFNVGKAVDTVVSVVSGSLEEKSLNLKVEMNTEHDYIMGDSLRLRQILVNLLGNAVKFTPDGGSISLCVSEKPSCESGIMSFEISDTGRGMSEEFQKHLFEDFAQENSKKADDYSGTGLGLSISRMLAEEMGGSLTVASSPGKGSCFTVNLPVEPAESADIERAESAGCGKTKGIKSFHVQDMKNGFKLLLAEDNDMNAGVLSDILEQAGFSVVVAEDGNKALETVKNSEEFEFDIILMDVMMPLMDGYQAASAIRALPREDVKNMKIYACTANSREEDKDRAEECGMDGFISKPVDLDLFFELIKEEKI